MTGLALTLGAIAAALAVTYAAGAIGLVVAVFVGLILTIKLDPSGLARNREVSD